MNNFLDVTIHSMMVLHHLSLLVLLAFYTQWTQVHDVLLSVFCISSKLNKRNIGQLMVTSLMSSNLDEIRLHLYCYCAPNNYDFIVIVWQGEGGLWK